MEKWIDIPGYETLYQISNFGRVKSYERTVGRGSSIYLMPGRIIKQSHNGKGYATVSLNIGNKVTKTFYVHRLVAAAFIENPKNKDQVNHKDGNKKNNHYLNLEWCNAKENSVHAVATGLQKRIGENHSFSRLMLNTETGIFYYTMTEAAVAHNLKKTTLTAMLQGKFKNKTSLIFA